MPDGKRNHVWQLALELHMGGRISILPVTGIKNAMKPTFDLVLQRQIESVSTGNNAYLQTFLKAVRRADMHIRLIFAPWRSFGNRPWADVHESFDPLIDEIVWPRSFRVGRRYWSLSPKIWWRFGKRLAKEVVRRLGQDIQIHSFLGTPLDKSEEQIVVHQCTASQSDIVVAEYSSLGPILDALPDHKVRGVFMHDLMSARADEFRKKGLDTDFLEVTTAGELEWVKSANLMIYASANEMASFGSHMPDAQAVWLCPEPPTYPVRDALEAPRLVFLGTQHAGNTDSINHFLADVWPQVRERLPEIECWIAGSTGRDVEAEYQTLDGVKILGRVDDLSDIGGPSSIGLAPTRLASGVSIKVAEYLMLGMTCVSYSKALQGFGDKLDALVEIQDDIPAYVDAIVALVEDEAKRVAHAKRAPEAVAALGSNQDVVRTLKDMVKP